MEKISDRIRKIFEGLDENEKFGLLPLRLQRYKLDNEESAALIEMSQKKTGIEF